MTRKDNTVGVWWSGCSPMFTSLARSWDFRCVYLAVLPKTQNSYHPTICVMNTLHDIEHVP